MATADLNTNKAAFSDGNDDIVIVKALGYVPGGRTLDVSGVATDVEYIRAGHVIVQDKSTKEYSPLGVSGGNYDSIPSGKTAVGVLASSVKRTLPMASIVTLGQINAAASPYPVTEALKKALPHLQFLYT